jgi:hypothetical protein
VIEEGEIQEEVGGDGTGSEPKPLMRRGPAWPRRVPYQSSSGLNLQEIQGQYSHRHPRGQPHPCGALPRPRRSRKLDLGIWGKKSRGVMCV